MTPGQKWYSEKRRDPRWQRRRLEIMERDKFTCQHCRATDKPLNVHHKFYEKGRMPWEYLDYALITLCEDCHKEEPARVAEVVAVLVPLLTSRFSADELSWLGDCVLESHPDISSRELLLAFHKAVPVSPFYNESYLKARDAKRAA